MEVGFDRGEELEAMGIYRLIRYNPTPTTTSPTTIFSRGIFLSVFP
jgi:hypothetical protein